VTLTYLILFVIQGVVFGSFCGWLALNKDRSVGAWFFLGFLFSLVALIAIAAAPKSLLDSPDKSG
jgi:ABC-type microcin C transport system permease subunit YejE